MASVFEKRVEAFLLSDEVIDGIRLVVQSTTRDQRQDNKNALIALVDEFMGGNPQKRSLVMERVASRLAEAYTALDDLAEEDSNGWGGE